MKCKSLYVLTLSLVFAVTGCAKDPRSATVTLGEYELKNNHTDFQQQLVNIDDEDMIDLFLENHKYELSSFSNSGSALHPRMTDTGRTELSKAPCLPLSHCSPHALLSRTILHSFSYFQASSLLTKFLTKKLVIS